MFMGAFRNASFPGAPASLQGWYYVHISDIHLQIGSHGLSGQTRAVTGSQGSHGQSWAVMGRFQRKFFP